MAAPDDAARWVQLAAAEHLVARTSLVLGDPDAAATAEPALQRSQEAAERALSLLAPDTARALAADEATVPWKSPTRASADALYWYARAVADVSRLSGPGAWAVASHRVRELMERCAEVAPDVDHGGPDRFLGEYFATPPVLELEDTERSRMHFERAANTAPGALDNALARARSLDVITQDRSAFEQHLRHVLEEDLETTPALEAENRLAQLEATALMRTAADLFE